MGDWMEGVVVAQLVMENSTARPKCVKGEQATDVQVTTIPLLDDDSDSDGDDDDDQSDKANTNANTNTM